MRESGCKERDAKAHASSFKDVGRVCRSDSERRLLMAGTSWDGSSSSGIGAVNPHQHSWLLGSSPVARVASVSLSAIDQTLKYGCGQ